MLLFYIIKTVADGGVKMVMDLTKEHPDKTLWKFLLPMMISVMFQQFYNIADSVIVGRFAGEDALAAVGASYPITIIFMAFAVGMNLGTSVVVSRLFGAGDKKGVKRAVTTALTACLLLSMILCILGVQYIRRKTLWQKEFYIYGFTCSAFSF